MIEGRAMALENIVVERFESFPMEKRNIEFVERKGLGHPDYIADAIAEASSAALCKEYLKRFGEVLHHNVDKVLVVGGQARPRFGGGEVLAPIYVTIAGRATTEVKTESSAVEIVPIGPILLNASRTWLKSNFRYLNPDEHVIIDYKVGKGSADLVSIFKRRKEYPGANDTSLGVGFAPLSETERLVLEVERFLNSLKVKSELPMVGEDVKVMAVRVGTRIDLTVAVAFVSRHIANRYEYLSAKEEVKRRIEDLAAKITSKEVRVYINTGDDPSAADESGYYLVVTGTSAEHGDDGATGRGNRANGLITPMRPMSMEAAAGKNPINHVGKLYNVLAQIIARRIVEETDADEAYVKLLSQIGRPINDPLITYLGIVVEREEDFKAVKREAEGIAREELNRVNKLLYDFMEGKLVPF
ncbi:MAG: methionine adenosyltransferase [Thermofilaceae archaeon]